MSPKNAKAAGTRREHAVRRMLEANDWLVTRAPASLGEADLVALKRGERPMLVQVKANVSGGPWANFRPRERLALREAASRAGAVAMLAHWPPHGELAWYDEAEWPAWQGRVVRSWR